MKKIFLLLPLLCCCALGQVVVGNGLVQYVTSAPSGSCSQNAPEQVVLGPGTIYTCQAGTWATVGGGGGSGTVTSIATTAPIGGGTITTTGTLTCTTCVTSSSPGAGVAHFAGGTQAVTSSAIVAADITNATITPTQLSVAATPAMVLLCSLTASGSATLEFKAANCANGVFSSTYHTYEFVFDPLTFNTTGGNIMVRMSTNGGTSYDTGTNYDWRITANAADNAFSSETAIRIFCNVVTTATPACAGRFTLFDPLNATNNKWMQGQFTSIYTNSSEVVTIESAFYKSATAVNAIEFGAGTSAGTFTGTFTGTITLYGITP